jgi:hypothetical protein
MAMFSTCRKCGCKAIVVPLVGALIHAAVHHPDICSREQPNGQGRDLFCTKYVTEPVHTHERGPLHEQIRWITVTSSTSASSTSPSYSFGAVSSGGSG